MRPGTTVKEFSMSRAYCSPHPTLPLLDLLLPASPPALHGCLAAHACCAGGFSLLCVGVIGVLMIYFGVLSPLPGCAAAACCLPLHRSPLRSPLSWTTLRCGSGPTW